MIHGIRVGSVIAFSVCSLFSVTFFLVLLHYNIWPLDPEPEPRTETESGASTPVAVKVRRIEEKHNIETKVSARPQDKPDGKTKPLGPPGGKGWLI